MDKGSNIGKGESGSIQDLWGERKRALIVSRDELLRLVGNREGIIFNAIRANWTQVLTPELQRDWKLSGGQPTESKGPRLFVPADVPGEHEIASNLTAYHKQLRTLSQGYITNPVVRDGFDLKGLRDFEKQAIKAGTWAGFKLV